MAIKIYKVEYNGVEFEQQFEESVAEALGYSAVDSAEDSDKETKATTPRNKAVAPKNK